MRASVSTFAWVCASVLLLPAVAHAADGSEPSWPWYLQFAGSILNFAILVFLIVRFGGPRVSNFLRQRQELIEKQMKDGAELRSKAAAQLDELEAKMSEFDEKRTRLLEDYRRAGEEEKASIIAAAEQQAKRIHEDAQLAVQAEQARAHRELEHELAQRALLLAEEALRQRLQPTQQKLAVDRGIEQIEALSATAAQR